MRGLLNKSVSGLLVLLLAFAGLLGLPALEGGKAYAAPTAEYPVTYGTKESKSSPKMDGNLIVWSSSSNIHMYDTSGKQGRRLTTSGQAYTPDVSGNKIVWSENRGVTMDLYLYDASNGTETRLTNSDAIYESSPLIDGNFIVYRINNGIYLYDIDKATSKKINTNPDNDFSVQTGHALSGDRVVWYEKRYNPGTSKYESAIYVYTISENKTETIATGTNQQNPAVHGSKIVWEDTRSDSEYYSTVYLYDLDLNQGKFLQHSGSGQQYPVIYNNRVAWIDNRGADAQVYMYNLDTSSGAAITTSNDQKSSVDMHGDTLVWSSGSNLYASANIGPSVTDAVNDAADTAAMKDLLEYTGSGFTLGVYSKWKSNDQTAVVSHVFSIRPYGGYGSAADVQLAFDAAIVNQTPLANVNAAGDATALGNALGNTLLQLDLTAYNALSVADRDAALHTMLAKRNYGGYKSQAEVQTALLAGVRAWTNASWKYAGEQGLNGWFGDVAADRTGKLYVAYQDNDHEEKATVRTLNGTSWQAVGGAGFTEGSAGSAMALAFDSGNRPYLAFADGSNGKKVTVKKFDGTAWQTVGSAGISQSNPFYLSIVIGAGDVPYVAWSVTQGSSPAIVKKWDGTAWVNAGNGNLSSNDASYIHLAADGNGVVYGAYRHSKLNDVNDGKAIVKKLVGSDWVQVGTPGDMSNAYYLDFVLSDSGIPYIAYRDTQDSYKMTLLKYTNDTWSKVDSTNPPKGGRPQFSLSIHNETPYVVVSDDEPRLSVLRLESGTWSKAGSTEFTDGAVDEEAQKLVFVGDTAYLGFLTRYGMISNRTTVMTNDSLNTVPTTILGSIGNQTLTLLKAGYEAGKQEARSIAAVRDGTGDLANLQVSLSGTNAGDFVLSKLTGKTLTQNTAMRSFTVKAKDGLAAGTYSATVTVTADQAAPVSFTVTQQVTVLKGDVNGDGKVTPADALYITKYTQGLIQLTNDQKAILDMNDDSKVDADDLKIIMNIYLGVAG
ncbi:hypothetical protein FE784_34350 [Paenibacillus hemerocallicola]|uniref:Dockerin domain-containing protein n=1 Tax=Paenibacillus hemerocallicola TaxID=1172614 RepID=A0A5C4T0I8_9BACL|nr:dockerin type I domain-containing protein [Paenibacillus hemerocallicola]TNJ61557.1 hypothetical protein FE784_34350 [Paenibacillus hemerocallicola]